MHYAILAAGNGSRLGSIAAKPLVTIGGETLVSRMLGVIAARPDVDSVSVITNSRLPEIERRLRSLSLPFDLCVIPAETLSAAHSLQKVMAHIPRGEKVVALTVDTVFSPEDFNEYVNEFNLMTDADALMAVTRYVDDEEPMFVEADDSAHIRAFADFPSGAAEYVSAGIYGLTEAAREVLDRGIRCGVNGLREFQRSLLLSGLNVRAMEFGTVIDVDRPHDLDQARGLFG